MNAQPGAAVISDFDGTLARLAVPWAHLRETLAVARIEDLWQDADMHRWDVVTRAEVDAARTAAPIPGVLDVLDGAATIAILTNNDESAVETFLARRPELGARIRAVVGRRTLAGPKTDFEVFAAGYARCLRAVAPAGSPAVVTYIGDMRYELDYARQLGAKAVDVTKLASAPRGGGER